MSTSRTFQKIYDILFPVLAVLSIVLVILDFTSNINLEQHPYFLIDKAILIIFALDYFARLFLSHSKWKFIKTNLFDLLAILPFSEAFILFRFTRLFRLVRVFRIFRVLGFLGSIKRRISRFLHTNGLLYGVYIMFALICIGSITIYIAEKGKTINSIYDAAWWTIFFTSAITSYFLSNKEKNKIDQILEAANTLSNYQLDLLLKYIIELKEIEKNTYERQK